MADLSISPEANGALAVELCPGAWPTGCVGVTPMSTNVAGILKSIWGAIPHRTYGVAQSIAQDLLHLVV